MWVLATSNVGTIGGGPWAGRHCIGCSMAVDAAGRKVAEAPFGVDAEMILHVNVQPQPRPARGCGWQELATKMETKS